MKNKSFSGSSLEEALNNDSLTQLGLELFGMVQPSKEKGYISFTKSDCNRWVDLPIDMIEEAILVGKQTCRDHSHPIVRITLKVPKDTGAQVFATLMSEKIPFQQQKHSNSGQQRPFYNQYSPRRLDLNTRATGWLCIDNVMWCEFEINSWHPCGSCIGGYDDGVFQQQRPFQVVRP